MLNKSIWISYENDKFFLCMKNYRTAEIPAVHIFIIKIAMSAVQDIAIFVLFIGIGYFGQVHKKTVTGLYSNL